MPVLHIQNHTQRDAVRRVMDATYPRCRVGQTVDVPEHFMDTRGIGMPSTVPTIREAFNPAQTLTQTLQGLSLHDLLADAQAIQPPPMRAPIPRSVHYWFTPDEIAHILEAAHWGDSRMVIDSEAMHYVIARYNSTWANHINFTLTLTPGNRIAIAQRMQAYSEHQWEDDRTNLPYPVAIERQRDDFDAAFARYQVADAEVRRTVNRRPVERYWEVTPMALPG